VKGQYVHHKELRAAMGVKIAAHNLESAVAGTQLYVLGPDDDVDDLKDAVMEDMQDIFSSVDRSGALLLCVAVVVCVPGSACVFVRGCLWGLEADRLPHDPVCPLFVDAAACAAASRMLRCALQVRACACRPPPWDPWRRCSSSCARQTCR
jgi:hypothetical protein